MHSGKYMIIFDVRFVYDSRYDYRLKRWVAWAGTLQKKSLGYRDMRDRHVDRRTVSVLFFNGKRYGIGDN